MSKEFMNYESITQLRDTQVESINLERKTLEEVHNKQYKVIEKEYEDNLKEFDKAITKDIKKLFKGIKVSINHNKYGLSIHHNNRELFNLEYNNSKGNDIDCYNELLDIYKKYYGEVKEYNYPKSVKLKWDGSLWSPYNFDGNLTATTTTNATTTTTANLY